ncbi:MAG: PDZ domain-containing protein [Longimicrobiales bacterium]|nr:PDZ domain-containing protein [Longimicrobiales bacterium]
MAVVAVAALAAGFAGAPLTAQDVRREALRECRCVDRNGNEIENCTCLRVPRVEIVRGPRTDGDFSRRARMGVWISEAEEAGTAGVGGVRISEIQEDGPAARAGLRAEDVVVRVAGRPLTQPLADTAAEAELDPDRSLPAQRFARLVGALEPGEEVEVEYLRGGERRTARVTPEAATAISIRMGEGTFRFDPDEVRMNVRELEALAPRIRAEVEALRGAFGPEEVGERARVLRFRADSLPPRWTAFSVYGDDPCRTVAGERFSGVGLFSGGGNCLDGVEFIALNPGLAEYFDAPAAGVLVVDAAATSTLGLRAGDVLLSVGEREVSSPAHALRILGSYGPDEEVRLKVLRRGRDVEVLGRRRGG